MARWVCPWCEREFGHENQAHVCVPAGTVEQTFAQRPEQRPIYDVIIEHLRTLGLVHEDAVKVGVFLKRERKFAEIRPMARALSVNLILPRLVESDRFAGHETIASGRVVHLLRLTAASQVDDEVRAWLDEAYLSS